MGILQVIEPDRLMNSGNDGNSRPGNEDGAELIDKSLRNESSTFRFSPRPNRAGEIRWREWGEKAFDEALTEGKLVFLSISAVWCHWCHVMDETTLSDPQVIERLNNHFIPIRVDSDMRPDINRRYNQGGWPSIVFLLPTGRHLAGMTYIPPAHLLQLLDRVRVVYEKDRASIEAELAGDSLAEYKLLRSFANGHHSGAGVVQATEDVIFGAWDRENGGLGDQPKFPHSDALEFILDRYICGGRRELGELAEAALDAMSGGDLIDSVEGGFFRYATSEDWRSPHYEKMLGDNAELISIYLKAAVALGKEDYKNVAGLTLEYVISNLYEDGARGFFGSQDADENYYAGNRGERAKSASPLVDRTVYVDSTASMISALISAAAVLENPELAITARRITDNIWEAGFKDSAGLCHFFRAPEYVPEVWGQPEDQVKFLKALIDLYELTLDPVILERANRLGDLLAGKYLDSYGWLTENSGGNGIDHGNGHKVLGDIPVDLPDMPVNGLAAMSLARLGVINSTTRYEDAVKSIVGSLSSKAGAYGFFAAKLASAIDFIDRGPLVIRVNRGNAHENLDATLTTIGAMMHPLTVVTEGDSNKPGPAAVCCSGEKCIRVEDVMNIAGAVKSALQP